MISTYKKEEKVLMPSSVTTGSEVPLTTTWATDLCLPHGRCHQVPVSKEPSSLAG